MDPLTITAASGLRARLESLDLLANNIANSETAGYKSDREFYNLYTASEAWADGAEDPSTLPVIEKNWTDLSQGNLRVTANPLDLALQGPGFFAVDTPAGVAYTRNGSFQISPGGTLVTAQGLTVRSVSGQPLPLDPALPPEIAPDGSITQGGQSVGKLAVMDFGGGDLIKQGNALFQPADASQSPQPAPAMVHQGKLEGSNVPSAESAVRLVSVMRQFEMLQKAISIGEQMNRAAVDQVAKVSG